MTVVTRFSNGAMEFIARDIDSIAQHDGILYLFSVGGAILHKWDVTETSVHIYSEDDIKFNN